MPKIVVNNSLHLFVHNTKKYNVMIQFSQINFHFRNFGLRAESADFWFSSREHMLFNFRSCTFLDLKYLSSIKVYSESKDKKIDN